MNIDDLINHYSPTGQPITDDDRERIKAYLERLDLEDDAVPDEVEDDDA